MDRHERIIQIIEGKITVDSLKKELLDYIEETKDSESKIKFDYLFELQKSAMVFGYKFDHIREIANLLSREGISEYTLPSLLRDFKKAYNLGFQDCKKMYEESIEYMKKTLKVGVKE